MRLNSSEITRTDSSENTLAFPAHPTGLIRLVRIKYLTLWASTSRRRAISPTVHNLDSEFTELSVRGPGDCAVSNTPHGTIAHTLT